MARPYQTTIVLDAADDNGIAESQTPLAADYLTLDGALVSDGVAVLDIARRVIVTSGGDDTGITFTVNGTNSFSNPISETFAGADTAAAQSQLDFLTVTSIYASDATADAVYAGTNGVGSTPWYRVNNQITPVNLSLWAIVTGSVSYSAQYTYDDPNGASIPVAWSLSALDTKTSTLDSTITQPVMATRLLMNSGDGTVVFGTLQAGIKV